MVTEAGAFVQTKLIIPCIEHFTTVLLPSHQSTHCNSSRQPPLLRSGEVILYITDITIVNSPFYETLAVTRS